MEIGEYLSKAITYTIDYARAGERIRGAMAAINANIEPLKELLDLDVELGPEIVAAAEALNEASSALGRAATFLTARYDERMDRLNAAGITGAGE